MIDKYNSLKNKILTYKNYSFSLYILVCVQSAVSKHSFVRSTISFGMGWGRWEHYNSTTKDCTAISWWNRYKESL